jgi:hypothetical protein
MCCLRYEHEFYVQSRKKYPKEGKPVHTSRGEEKVLSNDIFRERVTLRGTDGEVRIIALAALRDEMLAAGDALAHTLAPAAEPARVTPTAPLPVVAADDDEELDAEHALESEHAPDHLAGSAVAVDPALDVTMEWPAARPPAAARRSPRRRGRRGGRRNRSGGTNGARTPRDPGAPPTGEQ